MRKVEEMKNALRIVDGRVVGGHFIFIRDNATCSDQDLLGSLDLAHYEKVAAAYFPCRYAHIMRGGEWSGLADDWHYSLYNSNGVQGLVERLAQRFDLLRLAVGDADNSFECYHFTNAELGRGFAFDDGGPKPRGVILDTGNAFLCERLFPLRSAPLPLIMQITEEVQINWRLLSASVTTYSTPYVIQRPSRIDRIDLPSPCA